MCVLQSISYFESDWKDFSLSIDLCQNPIIEHILVMAINNSYEREEWEGTLQFVVAKYDPLI